MDTGTALEIVHAMAKRLYREHGEICQPAANPSEAEEALNIVEDIIVNEYGED